MAKEVKKEAVELTVEEKLKTLYQLQTILSEIDKIKTFHWKYRIWKMKWQA